MEVGVYGRVGKTWERQVNRSLCLSLYIYMHTYACRGRYIDVDIGIDVDTGADGGLGILDIGRDREIDTKISHRQIDRQRDTDRYRL